MEQELVGKRERQLFSSATDDGQEHGKHEDNQIETTVDDSGNNMEKYSSRIPPRRLLITAVAVTVLTYFPVGYHYSVLNVASDVFVHFINESYSAHYDQPLTGATLNALAALAVSVWQGGAAVGSMNACWVMDRFGRKRTLLLITGLLQIIGSALMAFAPVLNAFEALILGRFLAGLSSGLVCVTLRVFLSECSPDRFRGTVNSIGGLVMFTGVMTAMVLGLDQFLGTKERIPYLVGLCIWPAVVSVCVCQCFPRTPKYLYLSMNNSEKATDSLKFYHGSTVNIDDVFEELDQEKNLTKDQLSFSDAWKEKSVRLPLIISAVAGLAYSSTGIDVFDAYSTELFETLGLSRPDAQLASTLFNVAGVVGAVIAIFCVDRLPRKKFLLYTLGACFLCTLGIVATGGVHSMVDRSVYLGVVAVALLSIATFSYGLGPAAVLESLFAEVSPHKIRTVAGTVSETSFWVSNVFYMFVFPQLLPSVGCYGVLIFAVPLGLCLIYYAFRLPETGRKSVYEVAQKMLVGKSISTLPILNGSSSSNETNCGTAIA